MITFFMGSAQCVVADEPDEAVANGRQALNKSWFGSDYPWYDPPTDDVRRVQLPVQPAPTPATAPRAGFSLPGVGTLFQIVAWSLLVLLLAGIAYVLIVAYLNRDREPPVSDTDAAETAARSEIDRVEALPFRINRNTTDLLAEARRNYQAGNFAEAIIYLFSHQLVVLDRNQLIRLTRGKTNRQYLREMLPLPAIRKIVEQTMVPFEDVFFGNHGLDRARFESCWFQLDEFDRLVERGAV